MKLIERLVSKVVIKENDASKLPKGVLCRVVYPICNIGVKNHNERIYEEALWDLVENDTVVKEKVTNRTLYGQAEHPKEDTQSNLEKTSHIVTKLFRESDILEGKEVLKEKAEIDVLNTPFGKIIHTLFEAGCNVGTSTRADGELEEKTDESGATFQRVIPEKYRFITVDFTADPSTFEPYAEKIEHNIVCAVQRGVGEKKMSKKEGLYMIESFKSPEAKEIKKRINECDGKCPGKCNMVLTGVCACKTGPAKEKITDQGSQSREPIEDTDYEIVKHKGNEIDGHIEPSEGGYLVSYRLDGVHVKTKWFAAKKEAEDFLQGLKPATETLHNKEWGFFGCIKTTFDMRDSEVERVADQMEKVIVDRTGAEPYKVVLFLDSKNGRHLGDELTFFADMKKENSVEDLTKAIYAWAADPKSNWVTKAKIDSMTESIQEHSHLDNTLKDALIKAKSDGNKYVAKFYPTNSIMAFKDEKALKEELPKHDGNVLVFDVSGKDDKGTVEYYGDTLKYGAKEPDKKEEPGQRIEKGDKMKAEKPKESIAEAKDYEVGDQFFIPNGSGRKDMRKGDEFQFSVYNVKAVAQDEYPIGQPGWWVKVVSVKESTNESELEWTCPGCGFKAETSGAYDEKICPKCQKDMIRKVKPESFHLKGVSYDGPMKKDESIKEGFSDKGWDKVASSAEAKEFARLHSQILNGGMEQMLQNSQKNTGLVNHFIQEAIKFVLAYAPELSGMFGKIMKLYTDELAAGADVNKLDDIDGLYYEISDKLEEEIEKNFKGAEAENIPAKPVNPEKHEDGKEAAPAKAEHELETKPAGGETKEPKDETEESATDVFKKGDATEATVSETGAFNVGDKVLVNKQAGGADMPAEVTEISARTGAKASHGHYWAENKAYLVKYDSGTTEYVPEGMIRKAEVQEASSEDKLARKIDSLVKDATALRKKIRAEKDPSKREELEDDLKEIYAGIYELEGELDKFDLSRVGKDESNVKEIAAMGEDAEDLKKQSVGQLQKYVSELRQFIDQAGDDEDEAKAKHYAELHRVKEELRRRQAILPKESKKTIAQLLKESRLTETSFDSWVKFFNDMFTMSDEQIRKKFIEAISRHDVTKTATIKHLTEVRSTVALMEEKIKTDKAVATNLKAELAQVKESHTKALNELKAQHAAALKRALLDKHIALTLGLTGLSLNENALALLKQCEGEKEIDEMVEKFRRAGVEEVLHSKTDAITVESAEPPDPTKVEVVGRIGKAFQGMNKH